MNTIFFKCFFFLGCMGLVSIPAQEINPVDSLVALYKKQAEDTTKIYLANLICQNVLYTRPHEAYNYAKEMIAISRGLDYKKGIAMGSNRLAAYYLDRNEVDSSYHYNIIALSIYSDLKNVTGISSANVQIGLIHVRRNEYMKAEEVLNRNIWLYENRDSLSYAKESDFKYIGSTYHTLANANMRQGRYNLALKDELLALDLYQKFTGEIFVADAFTALGLIEMNLGNYEQSVNYSKRALNTYHEFKDLVFESDVSQNLGEALVGMGKSEEALGYFQRAIQIARENGLKLREARSFNLLGSAYMEMGDYPVALTHLKKSIQVYQDMDHATSLNETYGNLGSLYNKLNDPKTAITYLNRSIAISDSINSDHISAKAYLSRSESHSQLGAYKAALDDFMMYNRLNDSIFNTTKSKQIEEMRALFEIEQKEQEIALKEKEIESLEQKAEISNLQRILLGAALVLSLLGFYGLRQKIKRNKLERAKIQAELAFKKKELTTHALNLARKNEVLEALKQKAKELKQSETDSKGYAQLIRTINFDLQDDNNWENFSRYFEDVHKDFNGNVKRKYPDVTSNELRLMALLKMNLSSKEIANILNISSDGIKKARQRLRKKMRLSPEDSLETTVMAI